MSTPRHPRLARSRTAHTSDRQLRSPGRRPMTFTRRRVSPNVRSMKLEWRILRQCSELAANAGRSLATCSFRMVMPPA
jgi:hypothetical protein